MIAHIVLFRPRRDLPSATRQSLAEAMTTALRDIPSIRRARIGARVTHGRPYELLMKVNYEFAAILEFDDLEGLTAYLTHPAHDALGARFFEAFEEALMYDYTLEEGPDAVTTLL